MLPIESEYKKIKETTNKYKKQKYWKIAVGLNQVDDLKSSEELRKLAYENIIILRLMLKWKMNCTSIIASQRRLIS